MNLAQSIPLLDLYGEIKYTLKRRLSVKLLSSFEKSWSLNLIGDDRVLTGSSELKI